MIIELRHNQGINRKVVWINWSLKSIIPTFSALSYNMEKSDLYDYRDPKGVSLTYKITDRMTFQSQEEKKLGLDTHVEIRLQLIFFDLYFLVMRKIRQPKIYIKSDDHIDTPEPIRKLNRFLLKCLSPKKTFEEYKKKRLERQEQIEWEKSLREQERKESKSFHDTLEKVINVTSRFAITCLTINRQVNKIYELLTHTDNLNLTQHDRKLFEHIASQLLEVTTDFVTPIPTCCEIVREGKKIIINYNSSNEYLSEIKTDGLISGYYYISKADLKLTRILVSITKLMFQLSKIKFILNNKVFTARLNLIIANNSSVNARTTSFIVFSNEVIKEINDLIFLTFNKMYFQIF